MAPASGQGSDDEAFQDAFDDSGDLLQAVDESLVELEVARWRNALVEFLRSLTPEERRWVLSPFCHLCGRELPCADHLGKEEPDEAER